MYETVVHMCQMYIMLINTQINIFPYHDCLYLVETNITSIPAPLKLLDTSFSTHLYKLQKKKRKKKKIPPKKTINIKKSTAE